MIVTYSIQILVSPCKLSLALSFVNRSVSGPKINGAYRDGQLYVTIKKSIPRIVTTLIRIDNSYMMLELKLILCDG